MLAEAAAHITAHTRGSHACHNGCFVSLKSAFRRSGRGTMLSGCVAQGLLRLPSPTVGARRGVAMCDADFEHAPLYAYEIEGHGSFEGGFADVQSSDTDTGADGEVAFMGAVEEDGEGLELPEDIRPVKVMREFFPSAGQRLLTCAERSRRAVGLSGAGCSTPRRI